MQIYAIKQTKGSGSSDRVLCFAAHHQFISVLLSPEQRGAKSDCLQQHNAVSHHLVILKEG